jgi:DNA-binding transcriptional ArsR family regulator
MTDTQLAELREATALAEMFRLLGDATRVRILLKLAANDEMCVHDIATAVGASDSKVSQAMRLLRSARVVQGRRDGRHVYYRLDDAHVATLLEVCRDHLDHQAPGSSGQGVGGQTRG